MAKSYLNQNGLPRGIRNNNPGNIVISNNSWQGKIAVAQNTDGHFEQFTELYYGLRALAKLLVNKVNDGQNTIRKILVSYAPSFENDTSGYINYVSTKSGINPDEPLNMNSNTLAALMRAICEQENGKQMADTYITDEDIYNSIGLLPEAILQQIAYTARKNSDFVAFFLCCWQCLQWFS